MDHGLDSSYPEVQRVDAILEVVQPELGVVPWNGLPIQSTPGKKFQNMQAL